MVPGQRIIQAALFVGILYFYIPTTGFGEQAMEPDGEQPTPSNWLKASSPQKFKLHPHSKSAAFLPLTPIAFENATTAGQLFNEGMQLYIQGERDGTIAPWRGAIEKWEAARTLAGEQNDLSTKTLALSFLGSTYTHLGELDRAVTAYLEVLPLYRQQGDRNSEANILTTLAQVYARLGKYQEAIDTYQTARSIWVEIDYRTGEAIALNDLGAVFAQLGDAERALTLYEEARVIATQVSDGEGYEASILLNVAAAYSQLEQYQQAQETYDRVLAIWEQLEGENTTQLTVTRKKAATFNNLGYTLRASGQDREALVTYERALSLWQQVGDRRGEASTLTNIGVSYANLGDPTEAFDYYERALPLRQQVGDRRGEAETLYRMAQVERERGNTQAALDRIQGAIEIIETLRSRTNIASEGLRTRYFGTVQDLYEFYIDLLMELHRQEPDAGYDEQALHASERTRTRTLLELLGETGIDIRQGVAPQLRDRERSLQQQINGLAQRQTTLLGGEHTEEQAAEIATELQTLFGELDSVRGEIRRLSPSYAALTQPQPLDLEGMQKQVLDDDTLLLQYFLGTERSYLWAVSSDSMTRYELPPQADIERAVRNLRTVMTSARQRQRPEKVAQVTPSNSFSCQYFLFKFCM